MAKRVPDSDRNGEPPARPKRGAGRRPPRAKSTQQRLEDLERELGRQRMASQRDQQMARDFVKRLLPAVLPRVEGVSFVVVQRPAAVIGGDLYDVYEPGTGSVGFFFADPSGRGMPAALLTTQAKNAFDEFRPSEYSPRAVFERLNLRLLTTTPEDQFFTAFLAILDTATLRLRYVNASFGEPVIYGPDRLESLPSCGAFVGLFEDAGYVEREVQLRPGDHLLVHSDGLANALNAEGRVFGRERLRRFIEEHADLRPGPLIEKLLVEAQSHLGGQPNADDITLFSAVFTEALPQSEIMEVPSEPNSLPRVVTPIMRRVAAAGYGQRAEFAVRLALEEALINAMKHGNKMDRTKKIRIDYTMDDRKVTIKITDQGTGFDPHAVPDPTADENLEVAHGRGLALMRSYVDELSFSERGNEVTLVKYAPWA